jgi:hypothetical protein
VEKEKIPERTLGKSKTKANRSHEITYRKRVRSGVEVAR